MIIRIMAMFKGKAIIRVEPSTEETIYISRDKVPLLKLWLDR